MEVFIAIFTSPATHVSVVGGSENFADIRAKCEAHASANLPSFKMLDFKAKTSDDTLCGEYGVIHADATDTGQYAIKYEVHQLDIEPAERRDTLSAKSIHS